jgi:hypothetical protein
MMQPTPLPGIEEGPVSASASSQSLGAMTVLTHKTGLNEREIMKRQRYLNNSRFVNSNAKGHTLVRHDY